MEPMNPKIQKTLRGLLLLVIGLSLTTGCAAFKKGEPKHAKKGPPAHAPAHGYRAKQHTYYYYPDISVYFDRDRKAYFWMEEGVWRMGTRLPKMFSVADARRVRVTLDTAQPYTKHAQVKKDHPAKEKKRAAKKHHKGKSHKR